jgi:hypothetical protein
MVRRITEFNQTAGASFANRSPENFGCDFHRKSLNAGAGRTVMSGWSASCFTPGLPFFQPTTDHEKDQCDDPEPKLR